MLAIRLQRLGRKKVPVYRVAVQDARLHPSSGRVVTYVGSYDPHTKQARLDKEKVEFYLKNGAQPTSRVVSILKSEKVAVPAWVRQSGTKQRTARNPEKLRKNRPKDAPQPEAPVADEAAPAAEAEAEATDQTATPASEPQNDAPVVGEDQLAEEPKKEPETAEETPPQE